MPTYAGHFEHATRFLRSYCLLVPSAQRVAGMLTQGVQGVPPGPLATPLLSPQLDDSHPFPIAFALDLLKAPTHGHPG